MAELTSDPSDPRLGHGSDDLPTQQNEVYLVLSDEERARGFVRPVRASYTHEPSLGGCGGTTTMSQALAETYARDPHFYGSTYCVRCAKHRPVGEGGEFVWAGTTDKVGT